jgi:sugar lactone lactonase YvrE
VVRSTTPPLRQVGRPSQGILVGTEEKLTQNIACVNHQDYLIGVQSVVIDPLDRLWILDTGRVQAPDGVLLAATYGGPKLVGVNLTTNEVFKTIVFPADVAYPDSYVNDVRFDLRPNISESGQGIAYITDSSQQGHNAIIIVDLGTGESWRHLGLTKSVRSESQFLSFVWGQPTYYTEGSNPQTTNPTGSDGIALSADGERLYFGPFASRYLYSVPTVRLRDRSPASELLAQQVCLFRTSEFDLEGLLSMDCLNDIPCPPQIWDVDQWKDVH